MLTGLIWFSWGGTPATSTGNAASRPRLPGVPAQHPAEAKPDEIAAARADRQRVGLTLRVTGAEGEPLSGVQAILEAARTRKLKPKNAVAASDLGGRIDLVGFRAEENGDANLYLAARGYVTLDCGAAADLADGAEFRLRKLQDMKVVAAAYDELLEGVEVQISQSEQLDAEPAPAAEDWISGPEVSAPVYGGVTGRDGTTVLSLPPGRPYILVGSKPGYVVRSGSPAVLHQLVPLLKLDLVRVFAAFFTVKDDRILWYSLEAPPGLTFPPAVAPQLSPLGSSLESDRPGSACQLWVATDRTHTEASATVRAKVFLAKRGAATLNVHVRPYVADMLPEVIDCDTIAKPTGKVTVICEFKGRRIDGVPIRLMCEPPDAADVEPDPRRRMLTAPWVDLMSGESVVLPFGRYTCTSKDRMVGAMISPDAARTVSVGSGLASHVLELSKPLKRVKLQMVDRFGLHVRCAVVNLDQKEEKQRISRNPVNLWEASFWLPPGQWHARVVSALDEVWEQDISVANGDSLDYVFSNR
ncbi:MAG: hypothetical protein ABL997_12690 [Planctomycetota bacterium]